MTRYFQSDFAHLADAEALRSRAEAPAYRAPTAVPPSDFHRGPQQQPVKVTPDMIVNATAIARGERLAPMPEQPKPTIATADMIVAAAERARAGQGAKIAEPTGLAAAIIAAGKKARGL